MIRRDITKFDIQDKKERYAVSKVREFINGNKATEGFILVLYGLRRTGKTTIMEQALNGLKEEQCAFYEVDETDSLMDIQNVIIDTKQQGVNIICFDEITKASDFITNSSMLPDVFAKEGMKIIVTGTDSLCFHFASYNELFDRTIRIQTTYIPFAEHCDVLETNDVDDYIQFGGLMRKGEPEERIVHDYLSASKYLDSAVSRNIATSIKKNPEDNSLEKLSIKEIQTIIEKMVEIYSGTFSTKNMQDKLKKVTIDVPLKLLSNLIGENITHCIISKSKDIADDFVKIINADCKISIPITVDMVETFENYLIDLDVVSAISTVNFNYRDEFGWREQKPQYEYHIIQPAIKFNHLMKGKEFFSKASYYDKLLPLEKKYLQQKLDEKIYGDMLEQIVLYDMSKALRKIEYDVLKPSFFINGEKKGEFDMLIYDKTANNYYGFEIKHTANPFVNQEKHLQNNMFFDVLEQNFGNRENVCVLYRGIPFQGSSGTYFLNVSDFLRSVNDTSNIQKSLSNLTQNLPIYDVPSDVKTNPIEVEIKRQRANLQNKSKKLIQYKSRV